MHTMCHNVCLRGYVFRFLVTDRKLNASLRLIMCDNVRHIIHIADTKHLVCVYNDRHS